MPVRTCIDPADLQRFVEGGLNAAEMGDVGTHVEQCNACFQALRQLPESSLAVAMRATKEWPAELFESESTRNLIQQVLNRCADAAAIRFGADARTTPSKCGVEQKTQESWDFLAPAQEAGELGRLGPYRIFNVLGTGGMGRVFLAEDVQLKRPVALKVMKPALAADALVRQRFLGEAEKTAAIKHDHIVTIYQVGEDRGIAFLAMELLEGEVLTDRLNREGRLPVTDVLRIGREVAEGLAAAHKRRLIHRDIKPGNIWLENRGQGSESRGQKAEGRRQKAEGRGQKAEGRGQKAVGSRQKAVGRGQESEGRGQEVEAVDQASTSTSSYRVKILDFGLARSVGDDVHLTKYGVIIGTPAYMAPEQAKGGVVDQRCDVFSLGCVLYHACTGVLPFEGDDTMSTLLSRMLDHPRPPRTFNADVPVALSELIMQMLAKEPAQRPASARAVVQAIEDIERGAPGVERGAANAIGALRCRAARSLAPLACWSLGGCTTVRWRAIVRWRAAGAAADHHSDQGRGQGHRDQTSAGCNG